MKCLLIKNADVYAPQPLGIVDILIINDKIAKIGQRLAAPQGLDCQILDAQKRKVFPGYVDQHVHISAVAVNPAPIAVLRKSTSAS